MARIRLDRGQLGRVIKGEARKALRLRAPQVLNRAKILAPVDTGRLRSSGKVSYSGLFTFRPKATIVFDVEYAAMVNDGTRPHIIRPKNARVLRFVVGGRVVYARVVHHPGTRANPFLDRALREVVSGHGWTVTNA
jgi:hypothetical protein